MHPATAKTTTTAIKSTVAPKTMNEARDHMSRASGKKFVSLFCFCFLTLLIFLQDYMYGDHNDHRHYHRYHHHSTQQECKRLKTCCLKPLVSFLFLFFFTLLNFHKTTHMTNTMTIVITIAPNKNARVSRQYVLSLW